MDTFTRQILAAVDALDHWSRTTPSDMDPEEMRGWRTGKNRVLQVSEESATPADAADSLRLIVSDAPNPKNGRDRGRMRALNEALDALEKDGEGGGQGSVGDVGDAPSYAPYTDKQEITPFTNKKPGPFTPGNEGNSTDGAAGAMRMSAKTAVSPGGQRDLEGASYIFVVDPYGNYEDSGDIGHYALIAQMLYEQEGDYFDEDSFVDCNDWLRGVFHPDGRILVLSAEPDRLEDVLLDYGYPGELDSELRSVDSSEALEGAARAIRFYMEKISPLGEDQINLMIGTYGGIDFDGSLSDGLAILEGGSKSALRMSSVGKTIEELSTFVDGFLDTSLDKWLDYPGWVPEHLEDSDISVWDLADGEMSHRKCQLVTNMFVEAARSEGFDVVKRNGEEEPETFTTDYFQGGIDAVFDEKGKEIELEVTGHSWAEVKTQDGTYAVDFTASQFGYEDGFPIVHKTALYTGWDERFIDAMQMLYSEVQATNAPSVFLTKNSVRDLMSPLGLSEEDAENFVAFLHDGNFVTKTFGQGGVNTGERFNVSGWRIRRFVETGEIDEQYGRTFEDDLRDMELEKVSGYGNRDEDIFLLSPEGEHHGGPALYHSNLAEDLYSDKHLFPDESIFDRPGGWITGTRSKYDDESPRNLYFLPLVNYAEEGELGTDSYGEWQVVHSWGFTEEQKDFVRSYLAECEANGVPVDRVSISFFASPPPGTDPKSVIDHDDEKIFDGPPEEAVAWLEENHTGPYTSSKTAAFGVGDSVIHDPSGQVGRVTDVLENGKVTFDSGAFSFDVDPADLSPSEAGPEESDPGDLRPFWKFIVFDREIDVWDGGADNHIYRLHELGVTDLDHVVCGDVNDPEENLETDRDYVDIFTFNGTPPTEEDLEIIEREFPGSHVTFKGDQSEKMGGVTAATATVSFGMGEGLHMRPAATLTRLIDSFSSAVSLEANGIVSTGGIYSLLGLDLKEGDEVTVMCEGEDEAEALDHLTAHLSSPSQDLDSEALTGQDGQDFNPEGFTPALDLTSAQRLTESPEIYDRPSAELCKFFLGEGEAYFWPIGEDLHPTHAEMKAALVRTDIRPISRGKHALSGHYRHSQDIFQIESSAGVPVFAYHRAEPEPGIIENVRVAMPWTDRVIFQTTPYDVETGEKLAGMGKWAMYDLLTGEKVADRDVNLDAVNYEFDYAPLYDDTFPERNDAVHYLDRENTLDVSAVLSAGDIVVEEGLKTVNVLHYQNKDVYGNGKTTLASDVLGNFSPDQIEEAMEFAREMSEWTGGRVFKRSMSTGLKELVVTASEVPYLNRRVLYDLTKYIKNEGDRVDIEDFSVSSSAPDEDVRSVVDTLVELGIARAQDDDFRGGTFSFDKGKLEDLLGKNEVKRSDYQYLDVDDREIIFCMDGLGRYLVEGGSENHNALFKVLVERFTTEEDAAREDYYQGWVRGIVQVREGTINLQAIGNYPTTSLSSVQSVMGASVQVDEVEPLLTEYSVKGLRSALAEVRDLVGEFDASLGTADVEFANLTFLGPLDEFLEKIGAV